MGVATHDVGRRLLASLGKGGPVDSRFEPCADVPKAGGLLASGLWEQTEEHFQLPQGFSHVRSRESNRNGAGLPIVIRLKSAWAGFST